MISPLILGVITAATFWPDQMNKLRWFVLLHFWVKYTKMKLHYFKFRWKYFMPRNLRKRFTLIFTIHICEYTLTRLEDILYPKED